ncbi:MAG: glycosyltransferase, partial [Solirubrobacteraceae bacterium]
MRIAYLVSRFPHVSETFIVRELNAVAEQPGIELTLGSLFAPVDTTLHEAARPWLAELQRPVPLQALRDLLAWTVRRPLRVLSTVAIILAHHLGSPRLLVRALATVPPAAFHARRLARSDAEHVHAHYATYPALAAWVVYRLAGVPYSFTAHAHDIYIDRRLLRRKLADARFAVTISEFNRRLLEQLQQERDARTPVHLVRCGIEVARYRFVPRRPADAGAVRAACVASLQEYKGHR